MAKMYLGFYSFYKHFNKNRLLTDPSAIIGDDPMYGFVRAGQILRDLGHQTATLDMDDLEKFDVGLFFDYPTALNPYYRKMRQMKGKKLYLFLYENPANRPDNYWRSAHRHFDKVFTWDPTWIDHKKYFPFWYSMRIPSPFSVNLAEKKKFCVTIASQKYIRHPKELYSERIRSIRWFEQNHPEEFDLYGQGWDTNLFREATFRFPLGMAKLFLSFPHWKYGRFPSWKGSVKSKNAVMHDYKFALCYENAMFPGYVTEKIFDGLFAGCVPVYMGAPNVTDYIPAKTFIDLRNFKNYDDLYRYMKNMPEKEYLDYVAAIEEFVRGQQMQLFSAENFARVIIKEIVEAKPSA